MFSLLIVMDFTFRVCCRSLFYHVYVLKYDNEYRSCFLYVTSQKQHEPHHEKTGFLHICENKGAD